MRSQRQVSTGPMENPLYKTEMCRKWAQFGECRYGDRCQFAHGLEEVRPKKVHPKYKTQRCRTFWNHGYCPYNDRCRFLHDEMAPPPRMLLPDGGAMLAVPQKYPPHAARMAPSSHPGTHPGGMDGPGGAASSWKYQRDWVVPQMEQEAFWGQELRRDEEQREIPGVVAGGRYSDLLNVEALAQQLRETRLDEKVVSPPSLPRRSDDIHSGMGFHAPSRASLPEAGDFHENRWSLNLLGGHLNPEAGRGGGLYPGGPASAFGGDRRLGYHDFSYRGEIQELADSVRRLSGDVPSMASTLAANVRAVGSEAGSPKKQTSRPVSSLGVNLAIRSDLASTASDHADSPGSSTTLSSTGMRSRHHSASESGSDATSDPVDTDPSIASSSSLVFGFGR